jgi:hypothetical protein
VHIKRASVAVRAHGASAAGAELDTGVLMRVESLPATPEPARTPRKKKVWKRDGSSVGNGAVEIAIPDTSTDESDEESDEESNRSLSDGESAVHAVASLGKDAYAEGSTRDRQVEFRRPVAVGLQEESETAAGFTPTPSRLQNEGSLSPTQLRLCAESHLGDLESDKSPGSNSSSESVEGPIDTDIDHITPTRAAGRQTQQHFSRRQQHPAGPYATGKLRVDNRADTRRIGGLPGFFVPTQHIELRSDGTTIYQTPKALPQLSARVLDYSFRQPFRASEPRLPISNSGRSGHAEWAELALATPSKECATAATTRTTLPSLYTVSAASVLSPFKQQAPTNAWPLVSPIRGLSPRTTKIRILNVPQNVDKTSASWSAPSSFRRFGRCGLFFSDGVCAPGIFG